MVLVDRARRGSAEAGGLLRLVPEYYLANWASLAGSPVDGWTL
jgi:hypothetical protein